MGSRTDGGAKCEEEGLLASAMGSKESTSIHNDQFAEMYQFCQFPKFCFFYV